MRRSMHVIVTLAILDLFTLSLVAAEGPMVVQGVIREINPGARQLKIGADQGKELTVRVDERSKLQRNGQAIALDAFKKGMRVKATVEPRNGENHVVSMAPLTTAADVANEIRDALSAAKSYTFQHKDEYVKKLQRVMDQANDQIAQLQSQASRAGAEAKKASNEQIDQLRRLRDRVQKQAQRVQAATPAAWDNIKAGVSSALEDLRKGFEKAIGQISKS